MYKANPKVNEELKQRLPSPVRPAGIDTATALGFSDLGANRIIPEGDWPQAPQHLRTSRSPSPQPGSPRSQPRSPRSPRSQPRSPSSPRAHRPPASPRSPGSPRCLPLRAPGRVMQETDRPPGRSPSMVDVSKGAGSPVYRRHLLPPASPEASSAPGPSVQPDQGGTLAPPSPPSRKGSPLAPPSPDSRKGSPAVLDKEKNIAFLLKELDSLRDLNTRLQDKLALKEKELESRLVDAELQEAELEARACEKAGALVEEIYQAQRERDQAVMARLRLANEERDEALLRAKRLQQAATEIDGINPEESDLDLEELLQRVSGADSALGVERSGAVMVDRLQKARERRRNITAEEMNTVLEERDTALSRCKRVEQELALVREQSQTMANTASRQQAAELHQERLCKEELDALQRERDQALEHSQFLEAELQALRTYQSLHQSQCEQHQSGSPEAEQPPGPREGSSPLDGAAQPGPLLAQLQQLASEHHATQAQLQLSQQAERDASERIHKLERLVEVLRKKVGTGSVRTVI